jgi:hypothetical protein
MHRIKATKKIREQAPYLRKRAEQKGRSLGPNRAKQTSRRAGHGVRRPGKEPYFIEQERRIQAHIKRVEQAKKAGLW